MKCTIALGLGRDYVCFSLWSLNCIQMHCLNWHEAVVFIYCNAIESLVGLNQIEYELNMIYNIHVGPDHVQVFWRHK